jgi:uncharacterized protein (TIGR03792 family)
MIIEWLKIRVKPELREKYIQLDDEIWTPALRKYPAFLGKETWVNPEQLDEVVLVIRWESREDWKAIPSEAVQQVQNAFDQRFSPQDYEMLEEGEWQVRKFLQS